MTLHDSLAPHLAGMAARAGALDDAASYPAEDVAILHAAGLLDPSPSPALLDILRLLGRANPSVGRLYEAHVNAMQLITRYGSPRQIGTAADDCRAGHLFGLWVTDAPSRPLARTGACLVGAKGPCSGAGHLRRALVTVTDQGTVRMAVLHLRGDEPVEPLGPRLHGMRASVNGVIQLDGLPLADDALIGDPGDYLREPEFSTGAWRTMAVTLGALDALIESVRTQLRTRGHDAAPLQQARFGEMLVAQETAALWTRQAALTAAQDAAPAADRVAYVNLARIAVEAACFDAMRHGQRALGLAALLRPNPVERLLRDLTTYLRQPAPDAVLTEAAQHAFAQP